MSEDVSWNVSENVSYDPRPVSETPVVWIGPGQHAEVAGFDLTGAMVYVGREGPRHRALAEPSLIDPTRRVERHAEPSRVGTYYLQPYSDFIPGNRAAYLSWLENGRQDPVTNPQFVQLFIAGIERRIFVDIMADPELRSEIPAIRAALADLAKTARTHVNPHTLNAIFEMLDLMQPDPTALALDPPLPKDEYWGVPIALKVGLGRFVARREPIPAEWALSWASYRGDIPLRTPPRRCPEEYREMFKIIYRAEYGDGMMIRQGKNTLRVPYHATNRSIGSIYLQLGTIPDVFQRKGPGTRLLYVSTRASSSLDAYSRWIGQHPQGARSPASLGYLPPELIVDSRPAVKVLQQWIDQHLGDVTIPSARVPAAEIVDLWSGTTTGKMSPKELLSLVEVLGRFGLGIEPDPRYGRATIGGDDRAVLFRQPGPMSGIPSADYVMAQVAAHLAAFVATTVVGSDVPLGEEVIDRLLADVRDAVTLEEAEIARLRAYLQVQGDRGISLTSIRRLVDQLDVVQRQRCGEVAIAVATRSDVITPAIVTLIGKIFRQLRLDPDQVSSQLHAAMTSRPTSSPRWAPDRSSVRHVVLDRAAIAMKVQETSVVADLLGDIFTEEGIVPSVPAVSEVKEAGIAGLDSTHSALLRSLGRQDSWTLEEFAHLARSYHLLAAGAIDTLNEAALDHTDDPLISGDDPLIIDPDVLQELLS